MPSVQPLTSPVAFADLGVPDDLVDRLTAAGITVPTPIQAAAIADALAGRDVCGRAPTGSGKTLAFGIPLVARVGRVKSGRPSRPKALILAPTRELASQITAALAPLAAVRGRKVAAFYGGAGFGPQLQALRKGTDIAVACPGRLADLVRRGDISLREVEIVVLDEADRMADMGFLPEVRRLLDEVPRGGQTLLFSATLDGDVDQVVRRYQTNPARHEVAEPEGTGSRTQHVFWRVRREQRVELIARLVDQEGPTIVFCRTKRGADRLTRQLSQAKVSAAAIHGDRSQAQRERALAAFTAGKVAALVATDVAARGIHVDQVGCVVHYDPPADEKDYVHRSGRTGRAGALGVVVSLVHDEVAGAVKRLQRALGHPTKLSPPDFAGLAVDATDATDATDELGASAPAPRLPAPLSARPRGVRAEQADAGERRVS